MRGTQVKSIKHILGLHERPSRMSKAERWHYRQIKKRYKGVPSNLKATFLDNLDLARRAVMAERGSSQVPSLSI